MRDLRWLTDLAILEIGQGLVTIATWITAGARRRRVAGRG